MSDNVINDRTAAYLIRSKLKYSIKGLCEYIKDNHSMMDIDECRNRYAIIQCNDVDPKAVISDYLMNVLNETVSDLPSDVTDVVDMNTDLFFDVEESEDDPDAVYINLVED